VNKPSPPTWILFASGNSIRVELSLYDPAPERNRPIEAYMVSEVGADLTLSASRAAEAVYAAAHEYGMPPPPTVVGYDLPGLNGGTGIIGQSGGLALALALARKLWPESEPEPVAATGEIASGSAGGPLNGIEGFQAKARAVVELLPEGGWFFFPRANAAEIEPELEQAFAEHNIKARPVASVTEALTILLPEFSRAEETAAAVEKVDRRHFIKFVLLAIILSAGLAAAVIYQAREKLAPATRSQSQVEKSQSINHPPVPAKAAPAAADKTATPEKPAHPPEVKKTAKPSAPQAAEKPAAATAGTVAEQPARLPEITLSGTSGLAERLARRTGARLKALFDSDRKLQEKIKAVEGKVELLEIQERWNPESRQLKSTVTTSFSGRVRVSDGPPLKLHLNPVTVSGYGPMEKQLARTASLMVEGIVAQLSGRSPAETAPGKVPGRDKNRGFE
jgi:hypothetical protein